MISYNYILYHFCILFYLLENIKDFITILQTMYSALIYKILLYPLHFSSINVILRTFFLCSVIYILHHSAKSFFDNYNITITQLKSVLHSITNRVVHNKTASYDIFIYHRKLHFTGFYS